MSKELFISITPHETKVAMTEDEQLAEVYFERENEYTLAGSIYKGKVTRVLPGMQSAFVDIGLERDAFLYVTDFMDLEDSEDTDPAEEHAARSAGRNTRQQHEHEDRGEGRRERGRDRNRRPNESRSSEPRGDARDNQPRRDRPRTEFRTPEAGATVIEGDFSGEASDWTFSSDSSEELPRAQAPSADETHSADIIPETRVDGDDGGARRYQGRRGRGGRDRGASRIAREERPRERAFSGDQDETGEAENPPSSTPFLLPGESLQKYGARSEGPSDRATQEQKAHARNAARPSTEIDLNSIDLDAFLLPSERRARKNAEKHSRAAEDPASAQPHQPVGSEHSAREQASPAFDGDDDPTNASASVRNKPDVMNLYLPGRRKKKPKQAEAAEETTPVTEAQPAPEDGSTAASDDARNREVVANESAQEGVLPSEYSPNSDAAANSQPNIAASPASPNSQSSDGFGHGDLEEVEEDFQTEDDEFSGIGAAEYAEDEFAYEELEEESMNVASEDASSTAAAADQIVSDTEDADAQAFETSFDATGESDEDHESEDDSAVAVNGSAPTDDRTRERRGARTRRGRPTRGRRADNAARGPIPTISELLKEGQEVLVQIAKEPIAKKGARITSHIALPGRFLVFMPTVTHVGVSRKIGSDEERQRLKRILLSEKGDVHGGFIVRTAAAGASEDDLRADIRFLIHLWQEIKQRSDAGKPPALIYHDLNLVERILRDQVTDNFSSIWVDSEQEYERIVRFLSRFQPALVKRVKLYTKEMPLFEQFGIQDEINKALKSKVWLKSGGYIVINQTEALVAIDINTGKYVGKTTRLEDTIVKTNIDAIQEIVRQIRLRDLGGIIVIDFIDMDDRKNRQKVMAALEEALKKDRAPSKVLQFNDFGLVAITRKRVKQSLERTLGTTCGYCTGTGFVKSPTTICNEIWIEMRKMTKQFERHDIMLRVNPEVVKALKANSARWLQDMEELTKRTIIVKSDPAIHQEQFDIQ